MDRTAVIILHYKSEFDTRECLESLLSRHPKDKMLQIIVVANLASESFCFFLKKEYPQIKVIEEPENNGFAKGNNIGIKKALELGSNYLILLNNDTLISQGLIERLVTFAHKNPSTGLVSPKIYFAKGFEYHKDRYKEEERGKVIWYAGGSFDWRNIYAHHRGVDEVDKGQYDEVMDTDFTTGCCMLVKRAVVEKIGFLDEKYFLYFEDIDYSIRAKSCGFRIIYYPKAYLWHKNAVSAGPPGSPIHIYYQTRNRLYFGYKYSSLRTKKSLLLDSFKLLFKGGIYARAVKDYYLCRMERGSV